MDTRLNVLATYVVAWILATFDAARAAFRRGAGS